MTKKHFIELADLIKDWNGHWKRRSVNMFNPSQIEVLADFCESVNPHFDRQRWLDYIAGKCGPSGGKV